MKGLDDLAMKDLLIHGTITPSEKLNIKRAFRMMDHNHDGKICPKDLQRTLMTKGIRLPLSEMQEMIWECDDMRRGALSLADLEKMFMRRKMDKGFKEQTPMIFSVLLYMLFDRDDDGDVTPEELFSYAAIMGPNFADTIVKNMSITVEEPTTTTPDLFLRIMSSKLWTTKNGQGTLIVDISRDENKSEIHAMNPIVNKIMPRKPTAKEIYETHTAALKAKAGENALKKNAMITDSSMRKTRTWALQKALHGDSQSRKPRGMESQKKHPKSRARRSSLIGSDVGVMKFVSSQIEQKQREVEMIKHRNEIGQIRAKQERTPKGESCRILVRPPGMPTDDVIGSWFQEDQSCNRETQEVRAFARKAGIEIKVADQALEKFQAVDINNSGTLDEEEFYVYLRKFIFTDGPPALTLLKSCWNEVCNVITEDGSHATVEEVSFVATLAWFAKRFKNTDLTQPITQDIYEKLGNKRLAFNQ